MKAICTDTKTGEKQEFTIAVNPMHTEIIHKEFKRIKIWMACKMIYRDYYAKGIMKPIDDYPYRDYTSRYSHMFGDGVAHYEIMQRSRDMTVELKSC